MLPAVKANDVIQAANSILHDPGSDLLFSAQKYAIVIDANKPVLFYFSN